MNTDSQISGARVSSPAAISKSSSPPENLESASVLSFAAGEDTRAPGSLAPHTLDLALQQLHDTLKRCGAEQCENLIKGEETGYAQFIGALEKLSKLALDWEEHRSNENQNAKPAGFSIETQQEMELKVEGSITPTTG